jgi:hypothetical protein
MVRDRLSGVTRNPGPERALVSLGVTCTGLFEHLRALGMQLP